MADVEMTAEVFWQLLGMAKRAAVERGEPDARTRQVLQVSAENDRLRRQVADLHAAIALVKGVRVAIRPETSGAEAALWQLWRLLPPAQRDPGDEQPERDEP